MLQLLSMPTSEVSGDSHSAIDCVDSVDQGACKILVELHAVAVAEEVTVATAAAPLHILIRTSDRLPVVCYGQNCLLRHSTLSTHLSTNRACVTNSRIYHLVRVLQCVHLLPPAR